MTTERCPTGHVLARVWRRWSAEQRRLHVGSAPSMRKVSVMYLEGQPELLARWTTAASRPHWRVPMARVAELQTLFAMPQDEVDDLFIARVRELGDDAEASVLMYWLADFLDRTGLSDEDRHVLAAWRAAREHRPLGLVVGQQSHADLVNCFDAVLVQHEHLHEADRASEPIDRVGRDEAADRAAAAGEALAMMARRTGAQPRVPSPAAQLQQLLAKLRRGTRRRGARSMQEEPKEQIR